VTFSYNSGTDQLTINAPGGGSGVSSFNGRTGAVGLGVGDLVPLIIGSASVTVTNTGSTLQLTSSGGGGGVPISYEGAAENSITPANSASTNTSNLNALISSLNGAGGGTIWFNGPGAYQINSTINLMSHVSLIMSEGAYFSWTGSASGVCFSSAITDCLINVDLDIRVNEGSAFTGIVLNLHSGQYNRIKILGLGTQTAAGTFINIAADSTAGQPSFGALNSNRNFAFNQIHAKHSGTVGYGLIGTGIVSGYAGAPQGLTDNSFYDIQFANVLFRGIKFNIWTDSNTFYGNTYCGLTGSGSIGIMVNEGRDPTPSAYNFKWEHVAIDTFGSGLNRTAVVFFESKHMTIDKLFNLPVAENGTFPQAVAVCLSYLVTICDNANTMTQHYLGYSATTP
jgi:hypothetical protein